MLKVNPNSQPIQTFKEVEKFKVWIYYFRRENMTMSLVFYEWLGTLSKVVELGDTAFVILRKQPLLFLHW